MNEYVVFPEYLTARCCRDWPHIPGSRAYSCGICRKVPNIVNEPYKRLRTPEDDANVDVDDLLTRLEYAAGNFKPGYGDYEAVHDAIREIKKLHDILDRKHDSNQNDGTDPDDDIVSRLRDWAAIIDDTKDRAAVVMLSGQTHEEAANEIEMLRSALRPILDAYTANGRNPQYYDYVKQGLRKEWPSLARALDHAVLLTAHGDWKEKSDER